MGSSVKNSIMIRTCRFTCFFLLIFVSSWSCRDSDYIHPVAGRPLVGTWLYVERGYSPGAGYIIEKISSNPTQIIRFTAQNTVSTANLSDTAFTAARTYRVDSTGSGARLVLFDEKQQQLPFSMTIRIENDTLRLSPSCFEGCHFLFVRLR